MSLCQEVGCSRLGETAKLFVLRILRQQFVCLLEVGDDLSETLFLRIAGKGIRYTCRWLQFQWHATILLNQLEISIGTEEVTLAQTIVILAALLVIIQRYVLNQNVGRLDSTIHVVPQRLVGRGLARVQIRAIMVPCSHIVGTAGKLIDTHVIHVIRPDIVELELQLLISTCSQVVDTSLCLEVGSTLLCNQLLVEKRVAA